MPHAATASARIVDAHGVVDVDDLDAAWSALNAGAAVRFAALPDAAADELERVADVADRDALDATVALAHRGDPRLDATRRRIRATLGAPRLVRVRTGAPRLDLALAAAVDLAQLVSDSRIAQVAATRHPMPDGRTLVLATGRLDDGAALVIEATTSDAAAARIDVDAALGDAAVLLAGTAASADLGDAVQLRRVVDAVERSIDLLGAGVDAELVGMPLAAAG